MNIPLTLEDIKEEIHTQFQDKPPNGWLLGWDESRGFASLHTAAAPHSIVNCTSFDYGFCNWFELIIDSEIDECYWKLTIKLSFIVPAYVYYWTQYDRPARCRVLSNAPLGYEEIEDRLRVVVENAGFFEIPMEWYDYEMKGVELELSGTENVTLSKCLFSDYDG
ncbi:hypothetical protein Pla110_19040 [Polystyrenella longa]|uniref:Uncharacterized protein n=1 Tax=Polystyrenella longa TaxID=2528007 RepID=A0A518CLS8_9PLAN|nr:hypothetical protein [Polystyrenella longa]QDU80180.1 hypothetical protein Pla110_19040 [Polystyrenella longa]